ncbi:MAG: pilus assembly protein PilM [Armatimonadetes bacterium]|nr:pilus assembly protein PilM [Armatimonadota bacterium]
MTGGPFLRRNKPTPKVGVGIDIGTSQVKVVVCARGEAGVQVTDAWSLPVPAPDETHRASFRDKVGRWLRDAIHRVRQKGTPVIAAALPASRTNLVAIPLSPVHAGPTQDPASLDIQLYLPFPAADAIYNIQTFPGPSGRPQEVFLAAARKDVAYDHCRELTEIGVEPEVVDVSALANANLLAPVVPEGQVVAIMDIGAQSSEVVLLEGCHFRGAVSFAGAGDDLTDAMTPDYLGDARRAEVAKFERGILDADIRPAVSWWRDGFLHAVSEAIAACESQNGIKRLDRVVLFGGGALARGLRTAVEDYLETPTAIGNPWHYMDIAPALTAEPHPAFSVATGLAIRALGQTTFQADLKPKRRALAPRPRPKKADSVISAIWGLAIVILLLVFGMISLSFQRNYLEVLQHTLVSVEGKKTQILAQQKKRAAYLEAVDALRRAERLEPGWGNLLQSLFSAVPQGMSIQNLSWSKGQPLSLNATADSYGQVASYIARLEKSGRFMAVTLRQTRKSGAGTAFTLTISLPAAGGAAP